MVRLWFAMIYLVFSSFFHDFPMSMHLLFIKKKSDKSEKAILREKDCSKDRPPGGCPFCSFSEETCDVKWMAYEGMKSTSSTHMTQKKTLFASGTSCDMSLHLQASVMIVHIHHRLLQAFSYHLPSRMCDRKNRTSTTYLPYLIAFELSGINFLLKVSRSLAHLLGVFSLTKSIDVFWKSAVSQGNLVPHLESSAPTFCRKRERYQSVRRRDTALAMDLVQPAMAGKDCSRILFF